MLQTVHLYSLPTTKALSGINGAIYSKGKCEQTSVGSSSMLCKLKYALHHKTTSQALIHEYTIYLKYIWNAAE